MTYILLFGFCFFLFYFAPFQKSDRQARRISYKSISLDAKKNLLFFCCLYMILVLGLQYYVGTDYPSYYRYFDNGTDLSLYIRKKEYLFYVIAKFIYLSPFPAQTGFFVFGSIQVFFLYRFIVKINFERVDLFFLVYFTCATCFYNQMNALRQFTAMAIFLYGFTFLQKKRLLPYVFFVLLASLIHNSAILLILLYPVQKIFRIKNYKIYVVFLFVSIPFMFKGLDSVITFFVKKTSYAAYLTSSYFLEDNRKSFANILTKIVFFPFYIRTLCWYKKAEGNERFYINAGSFFYGAKLIAMSSFFLSRFTMYFDLITYVPLYYYVRELLKHENLKKWERTIELFVFLCISVGLWLLKVTVMANGEYAYESILFN